MRADPATLDPPCPPPPLLLSPPCGKAAPSPAAIGHGAQRGGFGVLDLNNFGTLAVVMAGEVLSAQNGDGRQLVDRALIDALLARRLDNLHLPQARAAWCQQHGVELAALRRVRETIGLTSDSRLAAKTGFQLGIELDGQTPVGSGSAADREREIDQLEKALLESDDEGSAGQPSASEITAFLRGRAAAPGDSEWCERNRVDADALSRVCDTYGRLPDPEAAAGSAFELAVEARREAEARSAA